MQSNEKIYNMLRSLFRYSKLKEMDAPEVLFENEGKMITRRIRSLSPEEIFLTISAWEEFYKEQTIQDEIQNKKLDADLNQFYLTMN
jgi:hypothetical protein